jgi:hypothetical protein
MHEGGDMTLYDASAVRLLGWRELGGHMQEIVERIASCAYLYLQESVGACVASCAYLYFSFSLSDMPRHSAPRALPICARNDTGRVSGAQGSQEGAWGTTVRRTPPKVRSGCSALRVGRRSALNFMKPVTGFLPPALGSFFSTPPVFLGGIVSLRGLRNIEHGACQCEFGEEVRGRGCSPSCAQRPNG